MDVVGSEIGQKMRSAIKAKLTELGCYVDDELPDYVMVMVANKRTRAQMEDDLQLFLGDNTELFVNWLHQVLKKLQEVTVPVPNPEPETVKEIVKEKKAKQKKDKDKTKSKKKIDSIKKAKKKDKVKEKLRKKEEKKAHKSKKKSKHHEMIRPNVPPLLMNMEKVSEPSITDVFAGQILKNHGIIIESPQEEKLEQKPIVEDVKRPILPIIDPATISQPEVVDVATSTSTTVVDIDIEENTNGSIAAPREEQIKEITEIEAKIQGLKQKLAEQLDSMSDDEDFLNIRTEAEELMNDFAEDVFQEISSQAPPVSTSPISSTKIPSPPPAPIISEPSETSLDPPMPPKDPPIPPEGPPIDPPKPSEPEVLPQIELNLPKRPVRERLGARQEKKMVEDPHTKEKEGSAKERKRTESPERFTPDREPDFWGKYMSSAKSRLGDPLQPCRKSPITAKRSSFSEDSDDSGTASKRKRRVSSSSSERVRVSCASVVRVRPRVRVAPSSSLLMRAVADAHKSLLNIPPKPEVEPHKVKRALVHPMRRCVDAQNILIQVPTDRHTGEEHRNKLDTSREEYIPAPLSKKFTNTDYVPSRRPDRTTSRKDDTLIIETINIHNTTVDKDKNTQFIVTMDGFNPNAFLAKKLKTEGLLDEEDATLEHKPKKQLRTTKSVLKTTEATTKTLDSEKEIQKEDKQIIQQREKEVDKDDETKEETSPKKRLSDTSDESDTQVILKPVDENVEKRKQTDLQQESPRSKKRKASPIVFDMKKGMEEAERKRQRTESASSDNHVILTTATNPRKYDALPTLPSHSQEIRQVKPAISQAEKKTVWCRSFPLCRYGPACAFQHPRCKFAAACTRRNCPYSHSGAALPVVPIAEPPAIASHVVPAANYKTISGALPSVCKYYPNCVNPTCHFYHPKPCRYGKACANKLECNFYHNDFPAKFRFPV